MNAKFSGNAARQCLTFTSLREQRTSLCEIGGDVGARRHLNCGDFHRQYLFRGDRGLGPRAPQAKHDTRTLGFASPPISSRRESHAAATLGADASRAMRRGYAPPRAEPKPHGHIRRSADPVRPRTRISASPSKCRSDVVASPSRTWKRASSRRKFRSPVSAPLPRSAGGQQRERPAGLCRRARGQCRPQIAC